METKNLQNLLKWHDAHLHMLKWWLRMILKFSYKIKKITKSLTPKGSLSGRGTNGILVRYLQAEFLS